MNFIEHLAKPVIGIYCYDIAPVDMTTFQRVNLNTNKIHNFNFMIFQLASFTFTSFFLIMSLMKSFKLILPNQSNRITKVLRNYCNQNKICNYNYILG